MGRILLFSRIVRKFEAVDLKFFQEVSLHFLSFLLRFAMGCRKGSFFFFFFLSGTEGWIRRLNSIRFERWPRKSRIALLRIVVLRRLRKGLKAEQVQSYYLRARRRTFSARSAKSLPQSSKHYNYAGFFGIF